MGIATGQALLIEWLAEKGAWNNIKTVCELGSQEPHRDELKGLLSLFQKAHMHSMNYNAKEFYECLGIEKYTSIDFNGEHDSLRFDINRNLADYYNYGDVFDLVTNFGTSEHCFNQFEVFKNLHNLCKTNGYILHTIPAQGWGNHCFYRYDKIFFEDLATANDYQILYLEPFLRLKPHLRREKKDTIPNIVTLCTFVGQEIDRFKANGNLMKWLSFKLRSMLFSHRIDTNTVKKALASAGKGNALFNITLACIFKKNNDKQFVTPIQGMYQDANKAITAASNR